MAARPGRASGPEQGFVSLLSHAGFRAACQLFSGRIGRRGAASCRNQQEPVCQCRRVRNHGDCRAAAEDIGQLDQWQDRRFESLTVQTRRPSDCLGIVFRCHLERAACNGEDNEAPLSASRPLVRDHLLRACACHGPGHGRLSVSGVVPCSAAATASSAAAARDAPTAAAPSSTAAADAAPADVATLAAACARGALAISIGKASR